MFSPLFQILGHPGTQHGIRLYLKRDDLLDPVVSGSKWRKLEPVVREVQNGKYEGILTFGGPFSNHIHAVAAAGKEFGFPTAGIVRGLYADRSNPTLSFAQSCGMALIPVSKQQYDTGLADDTIQEILLQYPGFYHLPEGGATPEGLRNCTGISEEILLQTPDISSEKRFVTVPAGTGTTAAGAIAGLGKEGTVLVFPAANYGVSEAGIKSAVETIFKEQCPAFDYKTDYLFGGFADFSQPLLEFVKRFQATSGILLDPVYTAKMMYGVFDLLEKRYFPEDSVVVALHTGGMQGWDGFRQRYDLNDE